MFLKRHGLNNMFENQSLNLKTSTYMYIYNMFFLVGFSNHNDSYWKKKLRKIHVLRNGGFSHKIPSPHLPWDDLASQPFEVGGRLLQKNEFRKPPIKPVGWGKMSQLENRCIFSYCTYRYIISLYSGPKENEEIPKKVKISPGK